MKITICSRNDMEKLLSQGKIENTAIISFHDPVGRGHRSLEDYKPIDFTAKCDRVMQIALHDLDPEALADFDLTVDTYFPKADELAEFIYKAKEDGQPKLSVLHTEYRLYAVNILMRNCEMQVAF